MSGCFCNVRRYVAADWHPGAHGDVQCQRERAILRITERATRRKRRELEVLVEERLPDMHVARADLVRLATLDGLTGLRVRRRIGRLHRSTGGGSEGLLRLSQIGLYLATFEHRINVYVERPWRTQSTISTRCAWSPMTL